MTGAICSRATLQLPTMPTSSLMAVKSRTCSIPNTRKFYHKDFVVQSWACPSLGAGLAPHRCTISGRTFGPHAKSHSRSEASQCHPSSAEPAMPSVSVCTVTVEVSPGWCRMRQCCPQCQPLTNNTAYAPLQWLPHGCAASHSNARVVFTGPKIFSSRSTQSCCRDSLSGPESTAPADAVARTPP